MEKNLDLSAEHMFMKYFMPKFSINDEEASKMNIPSNYNHYAGGDRHELIMKFCNSSKIIFKEILNTYDWEKNKSHEGIRKLLLYIIYPEKYLKDQSFATYTLESFDKSVHGGMKITIPGPDHLWDSVHHIMYLLFYCIKETKLYHLTYNTQKDHVLNIILYGYDKIKIMGLSARMREKLPHGGDLRRELNDIIHCEERKETSYKRKDNYKGIWDEEMLNKSRSKMVEIIKRYPIFRDLLDEKEDMERRYELNIIYIMNKELEQITIMVEDKLNKIKKDVISVGGTSEYVASHEIGYKIKYWENEVKSQLFDEIVDHSKNNNWGIKWKHRRGFNIDKLNKIYEEKLLEKIRYNFSNEEKLKNTKITTKLLETSIN